MITGCFFVVVEIERICYTLIYIVLDSYLKLMFLFVSAQDGAESSSAGSRFTQQLHVELILAVLHT